MRIGLSHRFQEQTGFLDITTGGGGTGRKIFSGLANNSPAPLSTVQSVLHNHTHMHSNCDLQHFHTSDTNSVLPKQAYIYTLTQQDHSGNRLRTSVRFFGITAWHLQLEADKHKC